MHVVHGELPSCPALPVVVTSDIAIEGAATRAVSHHNASSRPVSEHYGAHTREATTCLTAASANANRVATSNAKDPNRAPRIAV